MDWRADLHRHGAASGIGRATAARLLDEGARVVGADLAPAAGGRAARSQRWLFTHVDVADEDSVVELVRGRRWPSAARSTASSMRPGVAGGGPVHMLPADEWDRVIAVNLSGTFLTAKHVIDRMLRPADGSRAARLAWSRWPASRASRAPPAGAPTARRRAAW